MAAEIVMPQLGLTMTEGTVVKWLKKVGDPVAKGEPIFEVETDKVVQEVPSLEEGVLNQIVVGEGTPVPVGTVIAYVGAAGEADAETRGRGEGPGEGASAGDFVRSSPAARRLAEKLGVDLRTVRGTGPSGRVVEEDIRRAADGAVATPGASAPAAVSPISASPSPHVPPSPVSQPPTPIPLRGMRKVVAERMAHSFSTAPHFYLTVEVDAGALVSLRQQIAASLQKRHGVEPTLTDLLIKATAIALGEHPEANAAWAGNAIQRNSGVNVGVAAAVEEGLIVPVIPEADRLSLAEIARKRSALVERARAGQLTLPELEGGSFTLSNLGMFGIDQFQAIVNPPQAAILAVGRVKDRVVAVNGQVAVRPTMFMTLSSDHRLLDGAAAAHFLARVVELVEKPAELLLAE